MKRKTILGILITSVLIIAALALGPAKSLFQQHGKSVDITENSSAGNAVTTLQFDADSAYAFTAAQCDFGPRNMNSDGHDKCKKWIINKFRSCRPAWIRRHHAKKQ